MISLFKNKIDVCKYENYTLLDLQYCLATRINWLPIDLQLKLKILNNINSVNNNSLKELQNACIVIDIIRATVLEHTQEMLKGAHIMINDEGKLYDLLVEQGIVQSRNSSHHKKNKIDKDKSFQAGEIFREFLVGKTADGKTWFQLEAHSMGGLINFISHILDYILYKITRKNVSQYGLSEYVDSNPISKDLLHKVNDVKNNFNDFINSEENYKIQEEIDKKYENKSIISNQMNKI